MRVLATLALVSFFIPGAGLAGQVELETQLNGLQIETRTIGADRPHAGGGSGNLRVLEVINHDDVAVTCELAPAPNETLVPPSGPTSIGAGEQVGLRLAGSHTNSPVRATLACMRSS